MKHDLILYFLKLLTYISNIEMLVILLKKSPGLNSNPGLNCNVAETSCFGEYLDSPHGE